MSRMRRAGLAVVLGVVWLPLFARGAPAQTGHPGEAIAAALRDGNFAEAAERSRAALLKDPNDARLWTLNGHALAGVGRRIEALQAFQRALKLDPNFVSALGDQTSAIVFGDPREIQRAASEGKFVLSDDADKPRREGQAFEHAVEKKLGVTERRP
jgi:cytochrome c-type biogenesis protein CcmH/NrfG